jgi:UbiD family decarboxylase
MSLQTTERTYADLHEHLDRLDEAGLLCRINEPVNKDTEMHPLVRWQFRGGIPEAQRKAFLFTNITDSKGRRYNIPVVIGAFAANPEIYRIGMNVPRLEDIGPAWERALANPTRLANRTVMSLLRTTISLSKCRRSPAGVMRF